MNASSASFSEPEVERTLELTVKEKVRVLCVNVPVMPDHDNGVIAAFVAAVDDGTVNDAVGLPEIRSISRLNFTSTSSTARRGEKN